MHMKKILLLMGLAMGAAGCAAPVAVEGGKMSAQNECGERSATLSQYNECTKRVDTRYREYESQRSQSEKDGG